MRGGDHTILDGTGKRDWMYAVARMQDRDKFHTPPHVPRAKENTESFAAYGGFLVGMRCYLARDFHVATLEPISYCAVVMEAVTKICVLRPFRCNCA